MGPPEPRSDRCRQLNAQAIIAAKASRTPQLPPAPARPALDTVEASAARTRPTTYTPVPRKQRQRRRTPQVGFPRRFTSPISLAHHLAETAEGTSRPSASMLPRAPEDAPETVHPAGPADRRRPTRPPTAAEQTGRLNRQQHRTVSRSETSADSKQASSPPGVVRSMFKDGMTLTVRCYCGAPGTMSPLPPWEGTDLAPY